MSSRRHVGSALARVLALALLPFALLRSQDELGLGRMWTFHDPPLEHLKRTYDFVPDGKWLDAVRLASLRFGSGCSASFVSPHGLILTNHHCARSAIARAQGPADWVRDGFVAATHLDEVRLPDLAVEQLVAMRDVTDEMLKGVPGDDPAVQADRLKENEKRLLETARSDAPKLRPQVVALFHGAQYQLYQYRVFDDVRLVMAPHLQVAHFGGDPDNFVYPRYGIDFALCRAWVDGAPADTAAASFGWSDGPVDGQLVFLSGNPGSTQRLLTTAQLEFLRDQRYPRVREQIDHRLEILRRTAGSDPEQEKQLRTTILGYENGQKLYRGEHGALRDAAFLARKAAAESKFKARLLAVPELAARYGDVFDRLAEVATERRALEGRAVFHSSGGFPPLHRALALAAFERTGDKAAIDEAKRLRPAEAALQVAFFVDHLERARAWLPAEDPFLGVLLSGRDAADAAAILGKSRLADAAFFDELARGGQKAIAACDDVALGVARELLPLQEAARAAAQALDARERTWLARLGQALFAVYGHEVTPDATFTLRFSDGIVTGYDYNGTRAPWRTVFHGMFARHAEFDAKHPFDLPVPWLLAKDRIDLCAAVDFVCTVDSTGGNSGSPVIDAERRIVGLLFDGNIESLGNEFCFADRVERSVCVHPQAIVEALTKVYPGAHLVRELRRQAR